ncbi:MAG: RagB/SusD family nutrient uptake outer membrane protein [Mangrovibacterium sp.]
MKYMKYKSIVCAAALTLSFTACDSYLDVVPERDILSLDNIFQKESTALQFFYGSYRSYLNGGSLISDPALTAGGEFTTGNYSRYETYSSYGVIDGFRISMGLQSASDPLKPLWDTSKSYYVAIRDCNTFIDYANREGTISNMTDDRRAKYIASAKAIKALYYFELVRMYGPISLAPTAISVEADLSDMLTERAPVDVCFDEIVNLFDAAVADVDLSSVQAQDELGMLTQEAIMAYKAKALLWAASPLYNGNTWYSNFKNSKGEQLFDQSVDVNKWKRAAEAADEAVAFCEGQGLHLYNEYKLETSDKLNVIRNIQKSVIPVEYDSPELLHGVHTMNANDISYRLPQYKVGTTSYTSQAFGHIVPDMRMVELFYTDNGLPIANDRFWDYSNRWKMGTETSYDYKNVLALNTSVLNMHLKREARFYADIAFDKGIWKRKDEYVQMDPYRNGMNGITELTQNQNSPYNITGYWVKKLVSDANYAKGTTVYTNPTAPFPKLRMAELYLIQAEAWNEAEDSDAARAKAIAALDKVRERAGIPGVAESWESYSNNTTKHKSQAGLREIIQQERMIELAFEGHVFWDLRRWKIAHDNNFGMSLTNPQRGWNVFGETSSQFYNNYQGPIVVWRDMEFQTPRDYLWPIRDEEIQRAAIVQNPGW